MANDFDPGCKMHRAFLANDVRVTLLGLGFKPYARPGATELVFEKASSRLAGVKMMVYTTIQGDEVRGIGKDSIKVCTVYMAKDGHTRGLGKERRVHRTGDINVISGQNAGKSCQLGTHLTPMSGIKFKTIQKTEATNHKGKL